MTEPPQDPAQETHEPAASQESLAERLRVVHGETIDPQITLPFDAEGVSQIGDTPSSGVILQGLRAHRHAGTRYELMGEIARGGMGSVLRVWDGDLRRPLAMKFVLGQGPDDPAHGAGGPSPRTLWRFLEEAQVTGQLDHPGIVPVHELGLDADGRIYFTMRLVHGRDLKAIFRLALGERDGWSQTRALGVILKVCETMAFAHAKGVIHRDLKPANVMVGRFGEVYVMDWGLARVLGREEAPGPRPRVPDLSPDAPVDSSRSGHPSAPRTSAGELVDDADLRTMDGEVVGTPAYMSPEQAAGKISELDARSDVYSVGAMLYHLLAGEVPFEGSKRKLTQQQLLLEVMRGPPPPLAGVAPDAPAELHAICDKAMAREPGERYQAMHLLAQDLRAYLENRVVSAYRTGAVAELRKWVARNRGLAAAILVAVLASLIGVAAVGYVEAEGRAAAEAQRQIAEENADAAERSAEEARAQEAIAHAERENVLRLSAFQDLEDLRAEADALWPPVPELADEMRAWLARARALLAGLEPDPTNGTPGHRAQLAELRTRGGGGDTPSFENTEERWWFAQLSKLVAELEAFGDPDSGMLDGIASPFGWGVARRLAYAKSVERRSLSGEEARARWEEAVRSIADPAQAPAYGGLEIEPQLGLLPLGQDPDSGLWEFAELQSGVVPRRDAQERLVVTEASGIVLVLLPGGVFPMGAQADDPTQLGYDPQAEENESPVHEVELAPFFLSKYEATQGQWRMLSGANPSFYGAGQSFNGRLFDHSHPVENVSWGEARAVLARARLTLPTEAQWEYAARAGTVTPWWTGEDVEWIEGAGNVLDGTAVASGVPFRPADEWLEDGAVLHAPVGRYAPNPFGLYDVIGNVWELCLDLEGSYRVPVEPGTGLRVVQGARAPINRGGSWRLGSAHARSANRSYQSPDTIDPGIGIRPARPLAR